jgi:DNA polymerase-3 subunit beta
VGKRSGEGFVAHKSKLVNALSRTIADRLLLMDFELGRKGFLGYVKALSGSNIVKIVPASANGNASEAQVTDKRLKVVCGACTSYLNDKAWIGENTGYALAEVRLSPDNKVVPNLGTTELSEALARVLPFTTKDDARPVLQCVLFKAGDGKLTMIAADGFRLAIVTLDFDGEGQALVNRNELRGIANALRKAKRVRLSIEPSGESLEGSKVVIDTEAIRYSWRSTEGQFPDYGKVIPTDFTTIAHLDTLEAMKAVASFRALSDNPKEYPIDLTIGEGKVVMANPDEKGQAVIAAVTDGQCYIRVDGAYLADVLKACGGMVDLKLVNAYSPMLFAADGYQMVVMPMMSEKATEQQKRDTAASQAEAPSEIEAELNAQPTEEPTGETEEPTEKKPKRKRKKELAAVA